MKFYLFKAFNNVNQGIIIYKDTKKIIISNEKIH